MVVVTKISLLKYFNIPFTNYFILALNNLSFPSFPKSEQTPVLQDRAARVYRMRECVLNGFGLSREALAVLLDLMRSATIQTLVFLFCLASGTSYRAVSIVFDMPRSTVHRSVLRVTAGHLPPRAIQLLKTPEDLEAGLGLKCMLFF